jgi:hypothetical protein
MLYLTQAQNVHFTDAYVGFHNCRQWNLELDQQLPPLHPAIRYLMWTLICLEAPNCQLTDPKKYPKAILWTLNDARFDPDVFSATHANVSRPPMDKALRNEDGTMITRASWDVIKRSAKTAIGIYLRNLKVDESSKRYFRTYHTKEWNNTITFLETARPLVGLCAGHWKAEHVISGILTQERTSIKRADKKAQRKSQHDSDGEDFGKDIFGDGDGDDDDNDNDNDNDNDSTDFKGKKRSAPRPTTKAKRTKVQREPKPAARVKELPTNTKPKTQQQMKSLATETEAQHPVAQLKKKAQSKPSDIIYLSYLNQRYQLRPLKIS